MPRDGCRGQDINRNYHAATVISFDTPARRQQRSQQRGNRSARLLRTLSKTGNLPWSLLLLGVESGEMLFQGESKLTKILGRARYIRHWKTRRTKTEQTTPRYMYHADHEGQDSPRRVMTEIWGVTGAAQTKRSRSAGQSMAGENDSNIGSQNKDIHALLVRDGQLIYKPGLGSRDKSRQKATLESNSGGLPPFFLAGSALLTARCCWD